MEVEPRFPAYAANNWPYTWRLTHHSPGHQADNMLLAKLIARSKVWIRDESCNVSPWAYVYGRCTWLWHRGKEVGCNLPVLFTCTDGRVVTCGRMWSLRFQSICQPLDLPVHLGKYSDNRWWSSWIPFFFKPFCMCCTLLNFMLQRNSEHWDERWLPALNKTPAMQLATGRPVHKHWWQSWRWQRSEWSLP